MAEVFLAEALGFIEANRAHPFFLYYAFHQPHVPRLPGPRFKGATPHGARGDVIVEMEWCVGEVLKALERLALCGNTIVIFSSDNGPVLDDGYQDRAEELKGTHRAAGPLRGGKYSMFDGGTRVPFLLSWPGMVKPGESQALVCQVDFYASFAALLGRPLPGEAAPDSLNVMDALLGRDAQGRRELVTEGLQAKTVYRRGEMVFIPPYAGPAINVPTNTELGNSPQPQLYDLSLDLGQIRNIAAEHSDMVGRLAARLKDILAGRCTRNQSAAAGES
jgi:arylsulfatase A-like enzyme